MMRTQFSGAGFGAAAVALFATAPFLPAHAVLQEPVEVEEEVEVTPASLKSVPVPMPDNLGDYVTDMDALIKLGKAAFWDMQFGSDGVQACATCHFSAGADPRAVNQINPGTFDDNVFDVACDGGGGPNTTLDSAAWPFLKLEVPDDNDSTRLHDYKDSFSSQGVKRVLFSGQNVPQDNGMEEADPDGFSVNGLNVRRVEPRNTPSVINAVFFHRLFADGRASHFFNGRNPDGNQDPGATVLVKDGAGPATPQAILLNNAALASQATGPVLSGFEMSWDGRDWDEVGKRMLPLFPLAGQMVHPDDSVFSGCTPDSGPGLDATVGTYEDMVKAAFDSKFWSDDTTDFGGYSQIEKNFSMFFGLALLGYEATLVADDTPLDRYLEGGGEDGTASDELTAQEKEGFDIFMNRGDCNACHTLPEMGGAAISQIAVEGLIEFMPMENTGAEGCLELSTYSEEEGVGHLPFDPRGHIIDIMGPLNYETGDFGTALTGGMLFMPGTGNGECHEADSRLVLNHFTPPPYNSSVLHREPTHEEDFGVEVRVKVDEYCEIDFEVCIETGFPGIPEGDYMVVVNGAQLGVISMSAANPPAFYDSGFYNIAATPTERDPGNGGSGANGPFALSARVQNGEDIGQPTGLLVDPVPGDRIAVNGAFRTPHLRNIELTGPYMHNGGLLTLEQVVDFYTGGGHFMMENIDDMDPEVAGIGGMDSERKAALAAFLKRPLTDDRVKWQKAPFDHPQLFVPNGHSPVQDGMTMAAVDNMVEIEAVGAMGAAECIQPFHEQVTASMTVAPLGALHVEEDLAMADQRRMMAGSSARMNSLGRGAVMPDPMAEFADDETPRSIRLYMHLEPTETVHVAAQFDGRELRCEPASVSFTPENWFEAKEIKVYGLLDSKEEGTELQRVGWVVRTQDARYAAYPLPICDVMISDPPKAELQEEFEAETLALTAPMVIYNDASVSGGQYVKVPDTVSSVSDPATQAAGQLRIDFNVNALQADQGPTYAWVLRKATSWFSDSVWIQADGEGPWELWQMTPNGNWMWERISVNLTDKAWDFEEGAHFLTLAHSESNVRIDKVIITNDANFDPTQP